MKPLANSWNPCPRRRHERGFSLIELRAALLVLAVGLGALTPLLCAGMYTDNNSANNIYAHVNAPGSAVSISGQGNIYGTVVGNTITDTGNGAMVYDGSGATPLTYSSWLHEIAMRELTY